MFVLCWGMALESLKQFHDTKMFSHKLEKLLLQQTGFTKTFGYTASTWQSKSDKHCCCWRLGLAANLTKVAAVAGMLR